ncbi:MAG: hypothetical protein J5737_07550 [Bacteroidales bacterium]|nr:hypothetical protein [Bacteroidales bacterium]
MKKIFFALLAVLAFVATSCSSTNHTMKEPLARFEFTANDIVLSAPVTGEATITRILNVDWSRLFTSTTGFFESNISVIGVILNADAYYAIYDLLEKNPGYDFVLYPQTVTKTTGVQGIFTNTEVKVTARLGKLKK